MTDWKQKRSLENFGGLDALTPAEQQVYSELDTGLGTVLGDGKVPRVRASSARRIRARVLRWLILDPSLRRHEKGVQIAGALIVGDNSERAHTRGLDLEGCDIDRNLALLNCRFLDHQSSAQPVSARSL